MNTNAKFLTALVLLGGVAATSPAPAQPMQHGCMTSGGQCPMHAQMHGKGGHDMHKGGRGSHGAGHGASKSGQSPAAAAFNAVNEKMHRDMAIEFSDDADADFVRAMIPHHQGAVDMAKVVIAFGKDSEIKKLAEEVVRTQDAEIAFMRAWLKKRGQ